MDGWESWWYWIWGILMIPCPRYRWALVIFVMIAVCVIYGFLVIGILFILCVFVVVVGCIFGLGNAWIWNLALLADTIILVTSRYWVYGTHSLHQIPHTLHPVTLHSPYLDPWSELSPPASTPAHWSGSSPPAVICIWKHSDTEVSVPVWIGVWIFVVLGWSVHSWWTWLMLRV